VANALMNSWALPASRLRGLAQASLRLPSLGATSRSDVVADAVGEKHVVLKYDPDLRAERFERELGHRGIINTRPLTGS